MATKFLISIDCSPNLRVVKKEFVVQFNTALLVSFLTLSILSNAPLRLTECSFDREQLQSKVNFLFCAMSIAISPSFEHFRNDHFSLAYSDIPILLGVDSAASCLGDNNQSL